MERAFIVAEDSSTTELQPFLCKDEAREIQSLLDKNFALLAGDQIDPDSPCRWLLIKREMSVPDPYSGTDRWSIDFFFVDQNATPTFVECKRFADTRSRREVVGQMLEYAANGQHYWCGDDIRKLAEQTAIARGTTLDSCLQGLRSEIATSAEQFFQEVDRRLKAGEIRLVFFLDRAPDELKRLVEFLNRQMNLSEVLLVEARRFTGPGINLVVPRLYGFSEQARAIKRITIAEATRVSVATDWESFASNARAKGLDDDGIAGCRLLYDTCKELKADITWGRGAVTASFSPKWRIFQSNIAPFSVYATGAFELHLSSYQGADGAVAAFRERFVAELRKVISLRADYATNWYQHPRSEWLAHANAIADALRHGFENLPVALSGSAP